MPNHRLLLWLPSLLLLNSIAACRDIVQPDSLKPVFTITQSLPRGYYLQEVGAEHNPTGDQLGGKDNYSEILSALSDNHSCTAHDTTQLRTALANVSCSAVYVPNGETITISDTTILPLTIRSGVTLYSRRGASGNSAGRIRVVQPTQRSALTAEDGARVTGLRLEGAPSCCYGIAVVAIGDGFRFDNNEVHSWDYGIYITDGSVGGRVDHNHLHQIYWPVAAVSASTAIVEANFVDTTTVGVAAQDQGTSVEIRYNVFKHVVDAAVSVWDAASVKFHHNSLYTNPGLYILASDPGETWAFRNWCSSVEVYVIFEGGGCLFAYEAEGVARFDNAFGEYEWGSDAPNDSYIKPADFNGDGAIDLVSFEQCVSCSQRVWVKLGTGTGFGSWSLWATEGTESTPDRFRLADVSGDGKDDLVIFRPSGVFWVRTATGSGFNSATQWGENGADIDMVRYRLADFTGDGRADILSIESNDCFYVWPSNGSGFDDYSQWQCNGADINQWRYKVADLTNDGKADLVSFEGNNVYAWTSTGSSFNNYVGWVSNSFDNALGYKLGFWEGKSDGKADLLSYEPAFNQVYKWESTGSGFSNGGTWFPVP